MSAEIDEEEPRESALGATLHREYWGWDHRACITFCRQPPRRRGRGQHKHYCPGCGDRSVVRPMIEDIEPEPGRLGAMIAGFRQGKRDAERLLSRWSRRPAPVDWPCPICDSEEWKDLMADLMGQHEAHEEGKETQL